MFHDLLWNKLFSMGINIKLIKFIKNFYDNLFSCIQIGGGRTEYIKISQRGPTMRDAQSSHLLFIYQRL